MKPWEQTPILIKRTETKILDFQGPEWRLDALYRIGRKEYPTRIEILEWEVQTFKTTHDLLTWIEAEEKKLLPIIPTDPKILARRRKAVHGIRGRHQKRHCSNCLQK